MTAAEGYRVVVAEIAGDGAGATAEQICRDTGSDVAVGMPVDVASEDSTKSLAAAVLDRWGRIDVLVNNAGIYGDMRFEPVTTMDIDYWHTVTKVNLGGVLLCSRAVLPAMRQRRWGRIVNISSMAAYLPAGVYSVTKLAVHQLTWNLAREVGDDGITVNCVAPGTLDLESSRQQHSDEWMRQRPHSFIVKRLGVPRDIYAAIRYFASDDAEWCTGQTLMVNGGFSVHI
jgi:NAD(P)-dependent dehydrogenase (short-subunit alcohol dehydrogenase family)